MSGIWGKDATEMETWSCRDSPRSLCSSSSQKQPQMTSEDGLLFA